MLTKSLHTVTAVSRVVAHLQEMHPVKLRADALVKRALAALGQSGPWPAYDPTVLAAIKATKKLLEVK